MDWVPVTMARRHKKFVAARAFYVTLAIMLVFLCLSLLMQKRSAPGRRVAVRLSPRDTNAMSHPQGSKCHLVHQASDKCHFVRHNCADEEAGLLSYLELYYCRLARAKPVAMLLIILWLALLFSTIGIAASDFFCVNLGTIASKLGISESMAGVTFLAFGNGSPDVFSTFAAMKTHNGSLAVGELIGAAGFITTVVAGSMALVRPFKVARKSFVRDVGFFIVASSFSLVFLADGHLHLWECAVMVGFYVLYVVFVMIWHWTLQRRYRRKMLENAARSEFHVPGREEESQEPYHDEPEEDLGIGETARLSRSVSGEDFASLERGDSPAPEFVAETIDEDDETRDRYLAEISNNMRIGRPPARSRRSTMTPIRPSLVGALEFRAVLSSLHQSRNIQSIPINHVRRYSDDPGFTLAQQQETMSATSNPEINLYPADTRSDVSGSDTDDRRRDHPRGRAVSANDAASLQIDPETLLSGQAHPTSSSHGAEQGSNQHARGTYAPDIQLSPTGIDHPAPPLDNLSSTNDFLAPPIANRPVSRNGKPQPPTHVPQSSSHHPERPKLLIPHPPFQSPKPGPRTALTPSNETVPLLHLPSPGIAAGTFHDPFESSQKPLKWWPYKALPPPETLISTLFPTLYPWKSKSIWERLLGIVAAPSVFLLTITLPTVEAETYDSNPIALMPDAASTHGNSIEPRVRLPVESPGASPYIQPDHHPDLNGHAQDSTAPHDNDPGKTNTAVGVRQSTSASYVDNAQVSPHNNTTSCNIPQTGWDRWLVCLQLITAPWFIVLLVWANSTDLSLRTLLLDSLYSLLASFAALLLLLALTKPDKPPKHRYFICYLGFVVAIAWISTIANEVVGVLKAVGTILNISDAILGLTIFAVGNSLGDLVADITVARLGYPVMALSACFGGPMLNILLGIGVSGCYMTLRGASERERKHPGRPLKFKPYQMEVGGTLLISGVSLLVTLAALLIIVPLRGWWMDKRLGWGLVALWTASTVANVVAEVTGWSREIG